MDKTSCSSCGVAILSSTALKHSGLCAPCSNGTRNEVLNARRRAEADRRRVQRLLVRPIPLDSPDLRRTPQAAAATGWWRRFLHAITLGSYSPRSRETETANHTEWNAWLDQIGPTDRVWLYATPEEDWANLTGERGFAIVRNGEVHDTWLTMHN